MSRLVRRNRNAVDGGGAPVAGVGVHELQEVELVPGEASAAPLGLFEALRRMQAGERLGQARHTDLAALPGREILLLLHLPQERGQVALQQLAQHPLRHGLGRRIDDEDGAAGPGVVVPGGAAAAGFQNGELAGLNLAARERSAPFRRRAEGLPCGFCDRARAVRARRR